MSSIAAAFLSQPGSVPTHTHMLREGAKAAVIACHLCEEGERDIGVEEEYQARDR